MADSDASMLTSSKRTRRRAGYLAVGVRALVGRASAKQHVHGYAKEVSDVCYFEADLEAVRLEHFMSCLRKCRGQDPASRHVTTRPEAARAP